MLRYLLISALMLRYMLVPALLAASSPSDADTCICNHAPPTPVTKACKLVVRDFDGPAKLADASRASFMTALGKYEVIPLQQWEAAREKSDHHGPLVWQDAAKRTGVRAVIEAWINDEGGRHTLTFSVRDATTGSEIDTVSIRVNDKGVAADPASLMAQVEDLLEWAECKPQIAGH